MKTFADTRKQEWEWFRDHSYYDMTCVRLKGDEYFHSHTTFHFPTEEQALQFVELLKIAR